MVEALRRHPVRIVTIAFAVVMIGVVVFLLLRPAINSASPSSEEFPVRGIDISSHNGKIDFDKVSRDIDFVFIKATEGATWRDNSFDSNYENALKAGLKVGAYHYFRFDRPGISQAVNFTEAIAGKRFDMPVAIDVEDAGNAGGIPSDSIISRLHSMVTCLEKAGINVIFYTNKQGLRKYIKKEFPTYPLWICTFSQPANDTGWIFWQFSHSGSVAGIDGKVDLNVFNGSRETFEKNILNQSWNKTTTTIE